MPERDALKQKTCAAAAVVWVFATASLVHGAFPRPNIVLILTDDQGWCLLSGPMGPRVSESRSPYLETPNMMRLAREGMGFTSGYSPVPLCTPTRRSILCGTSAARSGPEFKGSWMPKPSSRGLRERRAGNEDALLRASPGRLHGCRREIRHENRLPAG